MALTPLGCDLQHLRFDQKAEDALPSKNVNHVNHFFSGTGQELVKKFI